MTRKPKIRWGTLGALIVGTIAELGDPAILNFLPEKVARPLALAALIVLAGKKALVREEHERAR